MAKALHASAFLLLTLATAAHAAVPADHAVGVTVVAQASPPQLTLQWPAIAGATQYQIYRRAFATGAAWGAAVATLAGTATGWSDTSVSVGQRYEYQVACSGTTQAYGYQLAGIAMPVVDSRGKAVLIVDDTMAAPLASELQRLQDDLVGDGWTVARHDVSRAAAVAAVRGLIIPECTPDPTHTQVFLFGHVPVPYAGLINPDGHPDHYGAWPADGCYADLNGSYTDTSADNSSSNPSPARPENANIPGDGKFDQSNFTGTSFAGLGRVDLWNMPSFALTETELLRQYLTKDHAFRVKAVTAQARGLVDDNFGEFGGEAFAQNGWRNFGELVGPANVAALDWFGTLQSNDYLLAYGCGGGWFQGAGGVGASSDFASLGSKAVFTMLFGSYFGDWGASDNFLRAPLANNGLGLTCFWAGRPNWSMHPMGLGEPIGTSARIEMAAPYDYPPINYGAGMVHVALMGDPTLRLHVVRPPGPLSAAGGAGSVALSWAASSDAALGYHVYRSASAAGPFARLTSSPVAATSYSDSPGAGTWHYLVKAARLEVSFSGSYVNTSVGVAATASVGAGTGATATATGTGSTTGTGTTSGTGTGAGASADGGSPETKCGFGANIGLLVAALAAMAIRRRRE